MAYLSSRGCDMASFTAVGFPPFRIDELASGLSCSRDCGYGRHRHVNALACTCHVSTKLTTAKDSVSNTEPILIVSSEMRVDHSRIETRTNRFCFFIIMFTLILEVLVLGRSGGSIDPSSESSGSASGVRSDSLPIGYLCPRRYPHPPRATLL